MRAAKQLNYMLSLLYSSSLNYGQQSAASTFLEQFSTGLHTVASSQAEGSLSNS